MQAHSSASVAPLRGFECCPRDSERRHKYSWELLHGTLQVVEKTSKWDFAPLSTTNFTEGLAVLKGALSHCNVLVTIGTLLAAVPTSLFLVS